MKFEIKNRYSGKVVFEFDCASLRLCVEAAVEQKVSLSGAYLRGADLGEAYLRGADLSEAYLRGADLSGADLGGADLSGAYLRGADLGRAYLSRADLSGAYLSRADLSGAKFDIPPASAEQAIKNLDQVAAIILEEPDRLYMNHWHNDDAWQKRTCAEEAACGTTHCLAGWLQVCSTDEKIRKLDPAIAGTLCAPVAAKMFYATNNEVIDWLRNREYAKESA